MWLRAGVKLTTSKVAGGSVRLTARLAAEMVMVGTADSAAEMVETEVGATVRAMVVALTVME